MVRTCQACKADSFLKTKDISRIHWPGTHRLIPGWPIRDVSLPRRLGAARGGDRREGHPGPVVATGRVVDEIDVQAPCVVPGARQGPSQSFLSFRRLDEHAGVLRPEPPVRLEG